MTAPDEIPDHETDDRLRRAAAALHRQVRADTDTDAALAEATAPRPSRRAPWLAAAAAVVVLLLAVGVVIATREAPEEVTVDDRRTTSSVPDPGTGPAVGAPDDGTASLDLPVTATPSTALHPGDVVSLAGDGFNPGRMVAAVQCTMDVIESSAGSAACDLGVLGTGSVPDAQGRATGSIEVRRVIQVGAEKVDCAAEGVRCAVAMGQIDDYDVSGAAEITFADDLPALVRPTMTVTPSTGLRHGDTVTVTVEGLTGPVESLQLCAGDPGTSPEGVQTPQGSSGSGVDRARCVYGLEGGIGVMEPDVEGRVELPVQVWRAFAPGGSGDVVDCATDTCVIATYGGADLDAAPVALEFDPDGPMPPQAHIEATPSRDLRVGDEVTVSVSGLDPSTTISVGACGDLTGTGSVEESCSAAVGLIQGITASDGTWTGTVVLPDPSTYGVQCTREWACALTVAPARDDGTTVSFLPPAPATIVYAEG